MLPPDSQTSPKEGVRKSFLLILCAVLAVACCGLLVALIEARAAPKAWPHPESSDLDSNGFIESGWMISITDMDTGDCPAGLYSLANMRLEDLARETVLLDEKTRDKRVVINPNDIRQFRSINLEIKIFIVPSIFGYELRVLSSRLLTEAEKERIRVSSKEVIGKACEEWNRESFHRKGWIP